MKKLKLIIPLTHIPQFQFIFCLFILLVGNASVLNAVSMYGCHIYTLTGTQQRVYYIADHSRDFPNNSGWIVNTVSYNTFNSSSECIVDMASGCTVYRQGSTGTAMSDILYSGGTEGTLYSYACPLDEYIPILFIFVASFGCLMLKTKTAY